MFHHEHIFPQSLNQTLTKNEETEVSWDKKGLPPF